MSTLTETFEMYQGEQTAPLDTAQRPVSFTSPPIPVELYPAIVSTIQQDADAQYNIRQHKSSYLARNPTQGMEVIFDVDSVHFCSLESITPAWEWNTALLGYGSANNLQPWIEGEIVATDNRLEYLRGNVTEWYINTPDGLEQGFTIHAPPENNRFGQLVVYLLMWGSLAVKLSQNEQYLALLDANEYEVLSYSKLHVIDALGKTLPSQLWVEQQNDDKLSVKIVVDDADAVYPIIIDPIFQQQNLDISTSDVGSNYGCSTAISRDGKTVVVGAMNEEIDSMSWAGSAYVFELEGTPPTWQFKTKLTAGSYIHTNYAFGLSVAIDGDTVVVGNNGNEKILVFVRDGNTWPATPTLALNIPPLAEDSIGHYVAIQGDTIFAGSPWEESGTGAVYLYMRVGGDWSADYTQRIGAPSTADEEFGFSLAVDGDTLVVGTWGASPGANAAYVYVAQDGVWPSTYTQKLTGTDVVAGDRFGSSVSVSNDSIVVGALRQNSSKGAAYVFRRSDGLWPANQTQKLTASDGANGDDFGTAVAVKDDVILIGAPDNDGGAVYRFVRTSPTSWIEDAILKVGNGRTSAELTESLWEGIATIGINGKIAVIGDIGYGTYGAAYIFPLAPSRHSNPSKGDCFLCYVSQFFFGDPIDLLDGNVRQESTDLRVGAAQGSLEFSRSYLQNQQDDFLFMGKGWTHNHAISLVPPVSGKIVVQMGNGGKAEYMQVGSTDHYAGIPGVPSYVDWDDTNDLYILTAADQSILTFDDEGRLLSRIWPNGIIWTYTYDGNPPQKPTEVTDNHGRGLQFTYIDNPSEYDDMLLWRVGDMEATGLDTGSPAGRYVEFGYETQKDDGIEFDNPSTSLPDALLVSVRDVRGEVWTYDYYGQDDGEDDDNKINKLIQRLSPVVDPLGSGTPIPIVLEELDYTYDGTFLSELQQLLGDGLTETAFIFQANEENKTEVITPLGSTTHFFDNGVYGGVQNPKGDVASQSTNFQYRVTQQADGNDNATYLNWSPDGKVLNRVVDALGAETNFGYYIAKEDTDQYGLQKDAIYFSLDAQNRKTRYWYEDQDAPRQATLVLVTDGDDLLSGDMETSSGWSAVNGAATALSTAKVDTGASSRQVTTSGSADEGIQSGTFDIVEDRLYIITARVFVEGTGVVTMHINGTTYYDKPTTLTDQWQTLRVALVANSSLMATRLQFLTDDDTVFYVDTVSIIDSTTLLNWREFDYNELGQTTEEKTLDPTTGDLVVHTTRSYYTSGTSEGLLQTVTQEDIDGSDDVTTTYLYDSAGRVVQVNQNTTFGNCTSSFTLYDLAGNVLASICNYDPGTDPAPTTVEEAIDLFDPNTPDLNRVTVYDYDSLGRRIAVTTDAGADYARTTLTVYDSLNRIVRTIANYVAGGMGFNPYTAEHDEFAHGADNTQNLVTDTAYNAAGRVRKTVDVLGNVTLFGYDAAGQLIKTVQNASDPDYNNDYTGVSPDPDLSGYTAGTAADEDTITTQEYDAAGNLVKSVDALGIASFTVYDGLNRPVKTIRSAKSAATVVLNAGDVGYDAENDPRSEEYVISQESDRDLISTTEYDSLGRVIRTSQLLDVRPAEQWVTMLYGYDALGRQVKTIRNASDADYDLAADPDLSEYDVEDDGDLDIVTNTVYNTDGRVLYTEDVNGTKTYMTYDGLGRQVRNVLGYVDVGETPDAWVWDDGDNRWEKSGGAAVSHGTDSDQNIVGATTFDADGRVEQTQDVLGRITRPVYDDLGRVVRTVTNFVAQAEDPDEWEWNNGWTLSDGTTPIDHGTDNDQNIITSTIYDAQGRVSQSIDHLNNVTQFVYDILGRRIMTIVNYVEQGSSDPADWVWDAGQWEDGDDNPIDFGADNDQNRITTTTYDIAGRVLTTRDAAGLETRYEYDAAGRQVQVIANYVNGVFSSAVPDEDLISTMAYNKAGQVVLTEDVRGTQTAFTYDAAGRRLTVTQAANNPLATTSYTNYDKAGRVLRTIANYIDNDIAPDEQDEEGNWLFNPDTHGTSNDINLITSFSYDLAGRRLTTQDGLANESSVTYYKDGQVESTTDPLGVVTKHRYDALRRRKLVVAGYTPGTWTDPDEWYWDDVEEVWKDGADDEILFGSNNDQNIITRVAYDIASRMQELRDANGNRTSYGYDLLNRRKSLTDPLTNSWETVFETLSNGHRRTVLTDPNTVETEQEFDRLGRLLSIQYGNPTSTPDVKFAYDALGNRSKMSEYGGAGFTSLVRETHYGYDAVHRLTEVGYDNDGDLDVDQTVSYEYDAGGLRTKLTLPGDLEIVYTYDARGNLKSLTDWDDQQTKYGYDALGRLGGVERPHNLRCHYAYDRAGRLRTMRHTKGSRTLAHFAYELDARGNRVKAFETLGHPATTDDVTFTYDSDELILKGTWNEVGGFKQTADFSARLKLAFFGDEAILTMGVGDDHSIYDIYINGSLWQSFNGYADSPDEATIVITAGVDNRKLQHQGPHILELRNRVERDKRSTGHKLRFKQLVVEDIAYTQHTIEYAYDNLSRLIEARYNPGVQTDLPDADLLWQYVYSYDVAGNRVSQSVAENGGSAVVTGYNYNAANQLTGDGTHTYEYDPNGNLIYKKLSGTPIESHSWNRANRLAQWIGDYDAATHTHDYAYNGVGHRVQQTVDSTVTQYVIDPQQSLWQVLAATQGMATQRFVQDPTGFMAQQESNGDWLYPVRDPLGTVRSMVDESANVLGSQNFEPFGLPNMVDGDLQTTFGFTGEMTDKTKWVYLRNRYYTPERGVFPNLDPLEMPNRYQYVGSNPIMMVDPSGLIGKRDLSLLDQYGSCTPKYQLQLPIPSESTAGITDTSTCKEFSLSSGERVWLETQGNQAPNNAKALRVFSRWGIVLTVACGTPAYWSDQHIANIEKAFDLVERRLLDRTGYLFQSVFGGLEFRHTLEGKESEKPAGITDADAITAKYLIKWSKWSRNFPRKNPDTNKDENYGFDFDTAVGQGIVNTIVHELGHILDYRTGGRTDVTSMQNMAVASKFSLRNPTDYNRGNLQEGRLESTGEYVADHFLNWVMYRNGGYNINPDIYDSTAPEDVRRIQAYWMGDKSLDINSDKTAKTKGIMGWAGTAAAVGLAARNSFSILLGED